GPVRARWPRPVAGARWCSRRAPAREEPRGEQERTAGIAWSWTDSFREGQVAQRGGALEIDPAQRIAVEREDGVRFGGGGRGPRIGELERARGAFFVAAADEAVGAACGVGARRCGGDGLVRHAGRLVRVADLDIDAAGNVAAESAGALGLRTRGATP